MTEDSRDSLYNKQKTACDGAISLLESVLGDRIKIAADRIGGLNVLAERLPGTSRRTLSDYVSGKSEPKVSALVSIAEATGASIGWLITGQDGSRANSSKLSPEDAERRLDEIEARLRVLPTIPVAPDGDPSLAALPAELVEIATDEVLPDRICARADLLLRLGFSDEAAERRQEERIKLFRADLRLAEVVLQDAERMVGWQPPERTRQVLLTLAIVHNVSGEHLVALLREMHYLTAES